MSGGNMANLSTILLLLLVNVVSIVGDHHYDYPWCPNMVEECYCRRKYNIDVSIYCEYLGNASRIPKFNRSDILFKEVYFRYDTRIDLVQKDSFRGLQIQVLRLQSLQIGYVDKDAFEGLEETLTHLHLDDNQISILHRNSVSRLRKLQYIGLHNNLMDSIPPLGYNFPELTYLYLFNNLISMIPSGAFRGMGVLRGLKLHNNKIVSLRTGVFDPLLELQDLELQGNLLTTLPGNIFRYLSKLTKLDLSHNRIYLLLTKAFYGLGGLQALHLSHNSLSEFQSGMFRYVPRIKYLTLRNNYATFIQQSTFNSLKSIKTLDLSYNKIRRIETRAFRRLYRLEKLYLGGNHLTHLDFFQSTVLGRIEILDLAENNITQIVNPAVFEPLSKLEQLDLSGNNLGTISTGVFRALRFLKKLKLAGNPLYQLREGVLDHLNLQELDMTRCNLQQIDEKAFSSLDKINYMWLDDNELEDFPSRLFNKTKNMNILSLTNNRLLKLQRDMFKGLTKLEALHLDNNRLTNITDYSFQFLGSLRELTVSRNQITEIFEHSFNDLKMLVSLDLSFNRITKIGRGFTRFQNIETIILKGNRFRNLNWFSLFYSTLQNLKLLDLSDCDIERFYLDGLVMSLKTPIDHFQVNIAGNPLSCSGCDLSWMSYIPYNSVITPSDVTCNKPSEVKGRPAFCCWNNTCMDDAIKNNTKLQTMCADAEVRLSEATERPEGYSTTETTVHEDTRSTPTAGSVMLNTTQESNTVTTQSNETSRVVNQTVTENYDLSVNGTETELDNEYLSVPYEHPSTSKPTVKPVTTTVKDLVTEQVNVTESDMGSGDVDKDLIMNLDNDAQNEDRLQIENSVEDDVNDLEEITTADSYWTRERTSTTTVSTTLLALLLTENTEPIESTTSGGDVTVRSQTKITDGARDAVTSEDEDNHTGNFSEEYQVEITTTPAETDVTNKKDTVIKAMNTSTEHTYKDANGFGTNQTSTDLLKINNISTSDPPSEVQSSGEPDESDMKALELEKKDSDSEWNVTDNDRRVPDELLEVEELLVVQNSTASPSNSVDTMFSSGEPDTEVGASELNSRNDGASHPPEHLANPMQPESDQLQSTESEATLSNGHLDLSSSPFLEELDDGDNDEEE